MKSAFKIAGVAFGIVLAQGALAHEGHEEPKSLPVLKGGTTKGNENFYFEYVYKTGGGTIYLYTHDAKAAAVAGIEASAEYEVKTGPKKTEKIPAKLTAAENSWTVDAKLPTNVKKYTLLFKVKDKGHDDTMKFVVEPK